MWTFTIQLDRKPDQHEIDAFFEAGLDDALVGGDTITVERDDAMLFDAIIGAVKDVRAARGPRPIGIVTELPDAVTLSDVAQRLGGTRTAESLRLLATGKRGPGGFPRPTLDTGNIRVYSWAQVAGWLRDVLGEPTPAAAEPELAIADQALRLADWARVTHHGEGIQQLLTG